jgi:hypothetical protein
MDPELLSKKIIPISLYRLVGIIARMIVVNEFYMQIILKKPIQKDGITVDKLELNLDKLHKASGQPEE